MRCRKKLDGLHYTLCFDSPRLKSHYKYVVQTLSSIISTSVIVYMYQIINWAIFQTKFSSWRGISQGVYARKFTTIVSKFFESVASCSERTVNQNTNIAAEVCKVVRKWTSGLTVKPFDYAPSWAGHGGMRKHLRLIPVLKVAPGRSQ